MIGPLIVLAASLVAAASYAVLRYRRTLDRSDMPGSAQFGALLFLVGRRN